MSGVALATVVGVPLGSWVGQLVGWRGVFWALAVVSAVAAVVIARLVPHSDREAAPSLREQAGVLSEGRLWLVLAATALVTGGFMAAFSYVSPLLTERTGLSDNAVPLVLVGFGVGALIGTNLAGRFGDRGPLRTFTVIAISSTAVLLLLIPLSTMTVPTIVLVVLLGATGMAVTAIATPLAVRFGHRSPSLAAALAVSAFNVGIAAGSAIAGAALESSLGTTGPEVVGAVMVCLGLVPLAILGALRATTSTSHEATSESDQVVARTAELAL
jgi:DHA1 family inner membrane transport protein